MEVHVLLLPLGVQGHLTPMLQLALILASQQGFLISLVLSARARSSLQRASSPLLQQPNIRIEVLNDGLNPDASFIPSVHEIMNSSLIMQQSLEQIFQALMASPSPVTYLISDTFCFWSQSVAQKFGVPRVELFSSPAYVYCIGLFHHRLVSEGLIPFKGRREDTCITCAPGLPPIKASDVSREIIPSEEDVRADPDMFRIWVDRMKQVYGNARDQYRVLVNCIYDLESHAFDALCEAQVQARAIGPLFLQSLSIHEVDPPYKQPKTSMYEEDHTCLQWLDSKAPASTLYVAFGSETRMAKQNIVELACGLEASGHSFLWVIRPGSVVGDMSSDDALPEGFKERICERGLVVSWAPQADVLAHFAVGGFLSHCGWNSTLEAMWMGVPILAWPQRADQGINKRYIEEDWKVGISIEKNEGEVSRNCIEKAVRSLMQGERSSYIRDKVRDVRGIMLRAIQAGGSSRRNLEKFIQDLRSLSGAEKGK